MRLLANLQALQTPGSPGRGTGRRRIAWCSPVPPARTGIADYSADLLPHLVEQYDIEVIVDPEQAEVPAALAARHRVLSGPEAAARHRAAPYDLFVYHVGNSAYHTYLLPLLWRYRGLVVLHDFTLAGLVLASLHRGLWPVPLEEELTAEGQLDALAHVREHGIDWGHLIDQAPLNRRVLEAAELVVAHSAWTCREVRRRVGVPAVRVPMAVPVLELATPGMERLRLGLPADAFLVCTLGVVGGGKRLESLLRAVAALPAAFRKQTVVAVVGAVWPGEERRLPAVAESLGVADRVRWVGRVPRRDFSAYARAADVCVQLRYPVRGETSAALYRALAAGSACVVSDQGAMVELPDAVAVKVRTPDHEVEDLTAALVRLYEDPAARAELGRAALGHVRQEHDPAAVAGRYAAAMDLAASRREAADRTWAEAAADALACWGDCPEAAALLRAWAALRHAGQEARAFPIAPLPAGCGTGSTPI
jgi:glycosyltransferase involved in cell wall biosynthesis